jgi:transposase
MYFRKGKTIAEIKRETKNDEKTIKKYIYRDDFSKKTEDTWRVTKHSKLDPFKGKIDTWLVNDKKFNKKQRHTAKRVFDRLTEEFTNFDASYRLVAIYVKKKKKEIYSEKDFFMPLSHISGEAQADFGAAQFYEEETLVDGHYFNLSFPNSNGGYFQLFEGEVIECWMQGMINIFHHIGGVPTCIWFDNASPLVSNILKNGTRTLTNKFLAFKNHYGFETVFCNINAGNEKGSIENKVGYHRRNMLVPVPEIVDLKKYNEDLLIRCDKDMNRIHYKKDLTIKELFNDDKASLLNINPIPFNAISLVQKKTDSYAKVYVNGQTYRYSVTPQYAHTKVWISSDAYEVRILDEDYSEIVKHKRLFGTAKQESMQWLPYLSALSKRPTALKYTGIYKMLPDSLRQYADTSTKKEVSTMLYQIAKITKESNFKNAIEAFEYNIEHGIKDADSILSTHTRFTENIPNIINIKLSPNVPVITPIKSNIAIYDEILKKELELNE